MAVKVLALGRGPVQCLPLTVQEYELRNFSPKLEKSSEKHLSQLFVFSVPKIVIFEVILPFNKGTYTIYIYI